MTEHEYSLRQEAELAAQDQRDNMGRECKVEYTGRGFVLRFQGEAPYSRELQPIRRE